MRKVVGSGPWLTTPHRWRRALRLGVITLAIVSALVLVFAERADAFCEENDVGCSLATGFVSTGVVILLGYLVLFVWTLRRALRYYSELAQTTPERLMPTAPRVRADAIRGRERLTATVARESAFSRSGAPILVVGETGAGRTTFLLALAQRLAQRGSVPVVVSLRGAVPPVSFRKLAEQELVRRIDPVVRAEADAQRVWRQLCADGRIVVLVDSLDDIALGAPRHDRDHAIRSALVAARDDRIAVVATAGPETIPFGAPGAQFDLGPLAVSDAVDYIEERVMRPESDRGGLSKLVDAGEITRSPLYLNMIAALYRADPGLLPDPDGRGRDALLVQLLDSWVELLEKRTVRPEVELEEQQRRRILDGLSRVAYAMTLQCKTQLQISSLSAILGDGIDAASLIEGASQLALIDTFVIDEDDVAVRFHHAIMQSYFTACYLRADSDGPKKLLADAGAESLDALLMWAALDHVARKKAASAFLKRAMQLAGGDDDGALAFDLAAQELASAYGKGLQDTAANATEAIWSRASPRARLAAVRRLDGRGGHWSFRVLYQATRDPSYRVRWHAARAVAAGGSPAFTALRSDFSATVESAYARRFDKWSDEATHDISVLGWIAPALAATLEGEDRLDLEAQLDRLIALVPDGLPPGTESSLAQGFKLAAERNPESWPAERARALLEDAGFWYSRICLLHALCLAAVSTGDPHGHAATALHERLRDDDEHPFVCEAARLCLRAIKEGDWRPFVWGDESAVIGRSASTLADATAVLVADLVVLLNLTEKGLTKDAIEERKKRTYGAKSLPYCLSQSRDRSEQLFHDCDRSRCEFDLCPYPLTAEAAVARGEFSQAFCEHQLELAPRRPRLLRLDRKGPGWWTHTTRSARRRFWERMENRVL